MLGGKNPFRSVKSVSDLLCSENWDSSVETLKRADKGARLLGLARDSFIELFGETEPVPPATVIESTVRLDPSLRELPAAVAALEKFVEPLRYATAPEY
jgi:hypothetical protein